MEYSFYRNSSGSFLVLREEAAADGYVRRMLETGDIPYLLEEHLMRLGDTCELHYRIGGMQTLQKRFEKRKMGTSDIVPLLDRIVRLREACAAHLLPENHLFLRPELIYSPYLEPRYSFLYVPEEEAVFEEELRLLTDFLIRHVSYEDHQDAGVEIVYALKDAAGRSGFDLREWWMEHRPESDLYGAACETAAAADIKQGSAAAARGEAGDLKEGAAGKDPGRRAASADAASSDPLEIVSLTEDWDMKWEEDPFVFEGSGAVRLPFFARLFGKKEKKPKKHGKAAAAESKDPGERRRRKRSRGRAQKTADAQIGGALLEEAEFRYGGFSDGIQEDGTVCLADLQGAAPKPEGGRTHVLIPLDGGRQIPLERPYLLVGTAARNADIVLEDHTVSRIHAELYCDASGVRIEDCNSSNGTLVDGQLLEPGEQKQLQTGMHIRLGRTEFVFR